MLLAGVAIASNPVFSTALLSLTEVPHWSLQGLGNSNEGQSLCFDKPNSANLVADWPNLISMRSCVHLFGQVFRSIT